MPQNLKQLIIKTFGDFAQKFSFFIPNNLKVFKNS